MNCWGSVTQLEDFGLIDAVFHRYFSDVPASTVGREYASARLDGAAFSSCSDDVRCLLMWACLLSPQTERLHEAGGIKTVGSRIEHGLTRLGYAPTFAFRVRAIASIAAEQQMDVGAGIPFDRALRRSVERYGRWKVDLATSLTRFAMQRAGRPLRMDEAPGTMSYDPQRGGGR